MKITLEIPEQITDAICTRFGYDQKSEEEKLILSREDFVIDKISGWLKHEASEHIGSEAAALASKTAKDGVAELEITKSK